MIGVKDPTEQPKVDETNQGNNAIVKRSITDLRINSMESFLELSKEMAESFRLFLDELKVRFEQFREQPLNILELLSLSNLHKWTQREQ